jgi:hypothetical protein
MHILKLRKAFQALGHTEGNKNARSVEHGRVRLGGKKDKSCYFLFSSISHSSLFDEDYVQQQDVLRL